MRLQSALLTPGRVVSRAQVVGFLPLGGDVFTTKDEGHIIITSKGANKAAVVKPQGNGELSQVGGSRQ
jgi:hypothetical protein